MIKFCGWFGVSLLLSGCALKHYPSSPPVSEVQAGTLDCHGVQQAISAQKQVQAQIDRTGEFNGLTVLGFIGDFGIGNGVAKSVAQKDADQRMSQLETLQRGKCQTTQPDGDK